jgi:hypothetical protein
MAQCKQCFTPVDGRATQVTCSECDSPMHKDCVINYGGASFCDVCFTVAQETPKSKYDDFELPEAIRRTHIETYRSCPFKFYNEVGLGHEQPPTSYTQVGIDLHDIFDQSCNDRSLGSSYALDTMKQKFSEYPKDLFSSGFKSDTPENMWKRTEDSVETFYDAILPMLPDEPFTTEETIYFTISEDLPKVRFTMDRVDDVEGELEMHDWKTGKVMVGKKLSSDLQAPLYIYGVRKHFGRDVRSFTFHYLQENKQRTFVRNPHNPDEYVCTVGKREYKVSLTNTIREINSIFSRIKKKDFNIPTDTRNMHFTCKMCHLKDAGLCQGAEEQSWEQLAKTN